MVIKLSIIHACTCRKVDVTPVIDLESIEWALSMFMTYQRESIELFEGEKNATTDEYIKDQLSNIEEYIVEKLIEKNVREFTKSTIRTNRNDYKKGFEKAVESLIDKKLVKKIGNKKYEFTGSMEKE